MGARAYTRLAAYADRIHGAIVEIGAERGEGSTSFLSALARQLDTTFYSVDIARDPFWMTGEQFLEHAYPSYGEQIGLAYLDNFDWTYEGIKGMDWYPQQVAEYAALGLELTNENSQAAHLKQAQLIAQHASPDCLILFDDTWPVFGEFWDGKGGTAVLWLLDNGFQVVEQSDPLWPGEECFDGYVLMGRGT